MSESASTTSGASALDDKTTTVQYKPATSLAGNNNALAHYEQSRGYDQKAHALSNIHGLYGWSCNLLDVISVYSLYPGKLPGRFSYKRPGYEATFIREKSAYLAEVSVTEQILRTISKFPEILGELSMRKQCVPGSFLSAHALEPGNEARDETTLFTDSEVWHVRSSLRNVFCTQSRAMRD